MSEHPIKELMGTTMDKIREMVDVNTVIGDPITSPEGTVIIPVSKVTYGFASGGSDFPSKTEKELFGGGAGAGITITPTAFIVIQNGDARLLHMVDNNSNTANNIVKLVPEVFTQLTALFSKDKKGKASTPDAGAASDGSANQG
ncbi:MAG: sporulation protein YtfJ [Clostridiales bacterium]|nr:sporulation protein YtfJ [Clostridiales bacterium]